MKSDKTYRICHNLNDIFQKISINRIKIEEKTNSKLSNPRKEMSLTPIQEYGFKMISLNQLFKAK